jgi:truncated hemoglobin YjbI
MIKQVMLIAAVLREMAARAIRSPRKQAILIAVALLLMTTTAWGIWKHYRGAAKPPTIQQLQARANDPKLSPEERRKHRREFRNAINQLTPEQQMEIFLPMAERWQRQMNRLGAIYASLPADKKDAFLDQQLAAMQAERERRQQEREAERQAAQQGNPANAQGGGQGNGNQRNFGQGNDGRVAGQGRMNFMKQMLDSSTPEERAQGQIYRQALGQRAAQTGVSFGGRGGGFF